MRAAFVPSAGKIEVAEFPVPEPGSGQVLVRMHRASICGSDLHVVYHGFAHEPALGYPGYPGHEGVGEIVASPDDQQRVGEMVLTVPPGHFGGCFAEYQVLDTANVLPLPQGDPAELMMGQQLGTTVYALRKFWPGGVEGSQTAAVIGAGSAGLFFVQQVRRLGFDRIVVSDLNAQRLAVAREMGATHTVAAPGESLVDAVHAVTGGQGAQLVVEAVGTDALRADAVSAAAREGVLGFYGFPERYGPAGFPVFDAFRRGLRVQFASGAQTEPGLPAFRTALELIRDGRIVVDYCTETTFPLEETPQAFEMAKEQGHGAVKIGIDLLAGKAAG